MRYEKHFKVLVFTNLDVTEEKFLEAVRKAVVNTEHELNSRNFLRWHIEEVIT